MVYNIIYYLIKNITIFILHKTNNYDKLWHKMAVRVELPQIINKINSCK